MLYEPNISKWTLMIDSFVYINSCLPQQRISVIFLPPNWLKSILAFPKAFTIFLPFRSGVISFFKMKIEGPSGIGYGITNQAKSFLNFFFLDPAFSFLCCLILFSLELLRRLYGLLRDL